MKDLSNSAYIDDGIIGLRAEARVIINQPISGDFPAFSSIKMAENRIIFPVLWRCVILIFRYYTASSEFRSIFFSIF